MLCFRCGAHVKDASEKCQGCGQRPRARNEAAPLQPGETFGAYRVREVIAAGPLGWTFSAVALGAEARGANVALKLLTPRLLQLADEKRAFADQIPLRISHPNLARVLAIGEEQGRPFIATELLEGPSLRRIIELRRQKGQSFTLQEVEPIVAQIAAALEALPSAHGNLKAENVIVLPDLLKLTDAQLGLALPRAPFMAAQRAAGAHRSLAPELLRGEPLDGRSDVYGLGVLLMELLPREGLSKAVEDARRRASSPRREERQPNATTLAAELLSLLDEPGDDVVIEEVITDPGARVARALDSKPEQLSLSARQTDFEDTQPRIDPRHEPEIVGEERIADAEMARLEREHLAETARLEGLRIERERAAEAVRLEEERARRAAEALRLEEERVRRAEAARIEDERVRRAAELAAAEAEEQRVREERAARQEHAALVMTEAERIRAAEAKAEAARALTEGLARYEEERAQAAELERLQRAGMPRHEAELAVAASAEPRVAPVVTDVSALEEVAAAVGAAPSLLTAETAIRAAPSRPDASSDAPRPRRGAGKRKEKEKKTPRGRRSMPPEAASTEAAVAIGPASSSLEPIAPEKPALDAANSDVAAPLPVESTSATLSLLAAPALERNAPARAVPAVEPATPVSAAPVSATPVSATPVSATPVGAAPVSAVPVSAAPVSAAPVSAAPAAERAATASAVPVSAAPPEPGTAAATTDARESSSAHAANDVPSLAQAPAQAAASAANEMAFAPAAASQAAAEPTSEAAAQAEDAANDEAGSAEDAQAGRMGRGSRKSFGPRGHKKHHGRSRPPRSLSRPPETGAAPESQPAAIAAPVSEPAPAEERWTMGAKSAPSRPALSAPPSFVSLEAEPRPRVTLYALAAVGAVVLAVVAWNAHSAKSAATPPQDEPAAAAQPAAPAPSQTATANAPPAPTAAAPAAAPGPTAAPTPPAPVQAAIPAPKPSLEEKVRSVRERAEKALDERQKKRDAHKSKPGASADNEDGGKAAVDGPGADPLAAAAREFTAAAATAKPAETKAAPPAAASDAKAGASSETKAAANDPRDGSRKSAPVAAAPLVVASAAAPATCPAGMQRVPGGLVAVGSDASDNLRNFGDRPASKVEVRSYCIDQFEFPGQSGKLPKVAAAFDEAQSACRAEGKRLCSEDEWEAACRGPDNLRFPYGKDFDAAACNTADQKDRPRVTGATGAFPRCKSGFGVYDLSGNAAEWTAASFDGGAEKAVKGGHAGRPGFDDRCASRRKLAPAAHDVKVGFRCCMDLR